MNVYTVLLVDDEEDVIQVIQKKINWEGLGFSVIGFANNGAKAFEMVEEFQPDVVMTDIKMPYMDGLELSNHIKADYPMTKILLFTGFDEFEYAREAVHLEVEEYILKPVNSVELTNVFTQLKIKLDQEISEKQNVEILQKYYMESLPLLQANFYSSLVEGRIPEEELHRYLSDYQISLEGPYYCCLVVHTSASQGPKDMHPLLLSTSVEKQARERLGAARKPSTLEKARQKLAEPRYLWARRGAAGILVCAFLASVSFLSHATGSRPVVNVCSWGEYIDTDLIDQFEEATGIRVNYQTADSNETLYSLLKNGGADYDVVVPSDYMIGRLIAEDMLEPLDYSQIPNFDLIDDRFKNLSYDPENRYTVPYTWGTLGIIYNAAVVDEEITSWGALYDDKYAGQVLLINNSRDAIGEALLSLGYSVNTTNPDEIRQAYELVADANRRGVFQGRVMDEIFQKMEGGNAAIATYYAGDYLSMVDNQADGVDLAFVIPEEGSNWFVDAMCMLKDAPHQREAHMWINFIASTEANLANMDYIWYASPNREALERYPAYYEELYGEELDRSVYEIMAAPPETLERCEAYLNLPPETLNLYKNLWTQLGAN